jgi:Arc/MetJ-type ribon-helix-helix transcriptional regulator
MNTISLKVPRKLEGRLERASKARGISKSEFVRQAVEKALDQMALRAEGKPNLLELAGDLVGGIKGAPSDLSHNPAYLKGYGEDQRG